MFLITTIIERERESTNNECVGIFLLLFTFFVTSKKYLTITKKVKITKVQMSERRQKKTRDNRRPQQRKKTRKSNELQRSDERRRRGRGRIQSVTGRGRREQRARAIPNNQILDEGISDRPNRRNRQDQNEGVRDEVIPGITISGYDVLDVKDKSAINILLIRSARQPKWEAMVRQGGYDNIDDRILAEQTSLVEEYMRLLKEEEEGKKNAELPPEEREGESKNESKETKRSMNIESKREAKREANSNYRDNNIDERFKYNSADSKHSLLARQTRISTIAWNNVIGLTGRIAKVLDAESAVRKMSTILPSSMGEYQTRVGVNYYINVDVDRRTREFEKVGDEIIPPSEIELIELAVGASAITPFIDESDDFGEHKFFKRHSTQVTIRSDIHISTSDARIMLTKAGLTDRVAQNMTLQFLQTNFDEPGTELKITHKGKLKRIVKGRRLPLTAVAVKKFVEASLVALTELRTAACAPIENGQESTDEVVGLIANCAFVRELYRTQISKKN
jgi:hypothetical protein